MNKFQYTYGSRMTMTPVEQAFAKVYDRLRKRCARRPAAYIGVSEYANGRDRGYDVGYEAGFKAALAELAQDNEMQYLRHKQKDYAYVG